MQHHRLVLALPKQGVFLDIKKPQRLTARARLSFRGRNEKDITAVVYLRFLTGRFVLALTAHTVKSDFQHKQ